MRRASREQKPRGKIGPWKFADYWALIELLSEVSYPKRQQPNTLSSIMLGQWARTEAEIKEAEEATSRIKGQALYKQLCGDANFRSARRLFLEQVGLPYTEHPATRREFEFLYDALLWIGSCFQVFPPEPAKWADSDARKQAKNALKKLSELSPRGVRLRNADDDRMLGALLAKLEQEMSCKRKPYESAATFKTGLVEKLTERLVRLGLTSHHIALDLAQLAELDLDESTIRKSYTRCLKAIHQQRLREDANRLAAAAGLLADGFAPK